jgi:hypothetical protein
MTVVARLLDHDSCESDDRDCHRSGERQIHDRDCQAARDPHPPKPPDERIQKQRDQQRHEEEEDHVTYGAGHDPRKDQQERQPDELHPARNLDARGGRSGRLDGGARHASDGTAEIRRIRDDSWGWSFLEDGGLALDRHELWVEPAAPNRLIPAAGTPQATRGRAGLRLSHAPAFDTVPPDMPSSRPNRRRRVERREVRAARRTRRFALLTLLAIVLVIALLLTAFGGGASQSLQRISVAEIGAPTQTQPYPQIVAVRGPVRLQMPIAQGRTTAIGYHTADDGAMTLAPIGQQGNEGVVQRVFHAVFGGAGGHPLWYQLDGGATSALDVGATPGTDVFSPVDGTIVGVSPYVVAGHRFGSRIDIQPQSAPSLVVTLTQLRSDPAIRVGLNVVSGRTKIGSVVNLAPYERQALAKYTNDAGNHVSLEVRPAAALVLN